MDSSNIVSLVIAVCALFVSAGVAIHQVLKSRNESRISQAVARSTLLTQVVESKLTLRNTYDDALEMAIYAEKHQLLPLLGVTSRVRDKAQLNLLELEKSYQWILALKRTDHASLEELRHHHDSVRIQAIEIQRELREVKGVLQKALKI